MSRLRAFLLRLFTPSETARCLLCRERHFKTTMYHRPGCGYFCDEAHADEFWEACIW